MRSWFKLLFWIALGVQLVGMAILSRESLPPANAAQLTGVTALPDGWTFPPGCLHR